MNASHTPGPWELSDGNVVAPEVKGKVRRDSGLPASGLIALVYAPVDDVSEWRGTQAANVRLIAAAPDLLAALKVCRSAINEEIIAAGDVDHPTIRSHAKAAEQADAAIAKAEDRA